MNPATLDGLHASARDQASGRGTCFDGEESRGDGVDGCGERKVGPVAVRDQIEVVFGLFGDGHHSEILREQHHTRPGQVTVASRVEEHGGAKSGGDVRTESRDRRGLTRGEAERAVVTMKAQVTPALRAGDQGRAELVTKAERLKDGA